MRKSVKEKSVSFYKRLILSVTAALILIPTLFVLILSVQNRRLKEKAEMLSLPDDVVTVGASQLESGMPAKSQTILGYQLLYSDFRTDFKGFSDQGATRKEVFLTFDDGPSMGSAAILDLLGSKNIKATFFVNGKSNRFLSDQVKRMAAEGHEVGMHSYSHRYKVIYASMDNLLDDFYRNFLYIKNETGKAPTILRFPGGSINIFNAVTYQTMISEMLRRGFVYYDWNVSGGDTVARAGSQEIATNILNGVRLCWGPAVVLLHDNGNPALPEALRVAIDTLSAEGYVFRKLDSSVKPPAFVYPD
jgi:peptidoglycan/xylan/chitin deacetylase (PgdA/CDA1 family)